VPDLLDDGKNIKSFTFSDIESLFEQAFDAGGLDAQIAFVLSSENHDAVKEQTIELLKGANDATDDDISNAILSASQPVCGETAASNLVGSTIKDEWILAELISVSGNAAVYRGHRISTGKDSYTQQVAIKVIYPIVERIIGRSAISHEAQLLSDCSHHNVVKIITTGRICEHGYEFPCLVMEFIEGDTLIDYINHNEMSASKRLALFSEICSAVRYLHNEGVIHSDLKPENILVTRNGTPKIIDFTVGVNHHGEGQIEHRGKTELYTSPEQAKGGMPTVRSDIYSLGVILKHIMTDRSTFKSLSNRWNSAFSRKAYLTQVINKATSVDPRDRYDSTELLSRDIKAVLERYPIAKFERSTSHMMVNLVARHLIFSAFFISAVSLLMVSYGEISTSKKDLEESNSLLTTANEKLLNEQRSVTTIIDQLTTVVEHVNVRNRAGEPIDPTKLLTDAMDATQNINLDFGVRFALAVKYGDVFYGNGDLEQAKTSFEEAISIAESGLDLGLDRSLLYPAVATLAEIYLTQRSYTKANELLNRYIEHEFDRDTPIEKYPIYIKYINAQNLLMGMGENNSLKRGGYQRIMNFINDNADKLTNDEHVTILFELSNARYYQFSGDEFSVTSAGTDDEIENVIRPVMRSVREDLLKALPLAVDHSIYSEILAMLSKVSFELNEYNDADKYGKQAMEAVVAFYQTKYHPKVFSVYMKYFSTLPIRNMNKAWSMILTIEEIAANIEGTHSTMFAQVFKSAMRQFKGESREIHDYIANNTHFNDENRFLVNELYAVTYWEVLFIDSLTHITPQHLYYINVATDEWRQQLPNNGDGHDGIDHSVALAELMSKHLAGEEIVIDERMKKKLVQVSSMTVRPHEEIIMSAAILWKTTKDPFALDMVQGILDVTEVNELTKNIHPGTMTTMSALGHLYAEFEFWDKARIANERAFRVINHHNFYNGRWVELAEVTKTRIMAHDGKRRTAAYKAQWTRTYKILDMSKQRDSVLLEEMNKVKPW